MHNTETPNPIVKRYLGHTLSGFPGWQVVEYADGTFAAANTRDGVRRSWLDWECERRGVTFRDPLPGRPDHHGWVEVTTWSPIPPYQMTDDYVFDL